MDLSHSIHCFDATLPPSDSEKGRDTCGHGSLENACFAYSLVNKRVK